MKTGVPIPIHDIRPLMEVPDSSFGIFLIVVAVVVILGVAVLYFAYKYLRGQGRLDVRKEYFKTLQAVDFSDAKATAYDITHYGRIFSHDSERMYEAYMNLVEQLKEYKYQKEVAEIDETTRSYYKIYLEMIDV